MGFILPKGLNGSEGLNSTQMSRICSAKSQAKGA